MALIPLARVPALQAERQGAGQWALRYGDEVLTWGELERHSTRRAHALIGTGVGVGDLVTLAVPNGVQFYEWMFALWKIGAMPHVVSWRLPAHELNAILEVAQPRVLIAADANLRAATALAEALPMEFGRHHANEAALPFVMSNPWKAMSSGGSTGRPKIIIAPLPAGFDDAVPYLLRQPKSGIILSTGPLYHNMPMLAGMRALFAGLQVVGMTRFDAEECLALIEQHRVRWTYFVPTMMMRIMRLPRPVRERYDLSSLETVWHWGAATPMALKDAWIEWLGAERIWELYGGTEGLGTTIINGVDWVRRRGSVGKPVVDTLRIQDENGRVLPPGEIGEIWCRQPQGQGSYRYLGAEPRLTTDGYETLGDFGSLDADGFLYIADRRTDMIVSGGANIFPAEVEGELMAHPGIEGAVVVGLPHEDLGAAAHAIVQRDPAWQGVLDAAVARDFLATRLARYKIPRSFEFTNEPVRDEAGKVRRAALRAKRIEDMEAGRWRPETM